MTFDEFKQLNKVYRLICDRDENLNVTDKESMFLPCYKYKGMIYWVNDETLGLCIFVAPTIPLETLKSKYNIQLETYGEKGNWSLYFKPEIYEQVFDSFLALKQPKNRVQPHSNKNDNKFLRVFSNISPRYKDILRLSIAKNSIKK